MQRLVTQLPLPELWNDSGPFTATWHRDLTALDLHGLLLLRGPVSFVVANIGEPLRWVPLAECWAFWKAEVQPHLSTSEQVFLENFPGGYCYFAAEWRTAEGASLIVLSVSH